ncbi:MAG TPA: hypothetical protein VK662_03175 [Acidothermaceae bacterium]|nr:hypothetical protein [Acidothermaceae bacterium]
MYGSETTNVFRLEVAQGDPNTAPAQFDQGLAQAEATIESALPPGASVPLGVQDLDASSSSSSGSSAPIGDKAVGLVGSETIAGKSINFTGIYVLSGGTFIFIGDLVLSRASPPLSAMEDQARVALSRI